MKPGSVFVAAFALALAAAQPAHAMGDMRGAADKAASKGIHAKGAVVSVNRDFSSVILKHEPIPALKWPAMTMGFKVKDKAQLAGLKKGDKVEFTLEKSGPEYVITDIR